MDKIQKWFVARFKERSTMDGTIIILISLSIIIFGDLLKIIAWGTLVYGIWTAFRHELSKSEENESN